MCRPGLNRKLGGVHAAQRGAAKATKCSERPIPTETVQLNGMFEIAAGQICVHKAQGRYQLLEPPNLDALNHRSMQWVNTEWNFPEGRRCLLFVKVLFCIKELSANFAAWRASFQCLTSISIFLVLPSWYPYTKKLFSALGRRALVKYLFFIIS